MTSRCHPFDAMSLCTLTDKIRRRAGAGQSAPFTEYLSALSFSARNCFPCLEIVIRRKPSTVGRIYCCNGSKVFTFSMFLFPYSQLIHLIHHCRLFHIILLTAESNLSQVPDSFYPWSCFSPGYRCPLPSVPMKINRSTACILALGVFQCFRSIFSTSSAASSDVSSPSAASK